MSPSEPVQVAKHTFFFIAGKALLLDEQRNRWDGRSIGGGGGVGSGESEKIVLERSCFNSFHSFLFCSHQQELEVLQFCVVSK